MKTYIFKFRGEIHVKAENLKEAKDMALDEVMRTEQPIAARLMGCRTVTPKDTPIKEVG